MNLTERVSTVFRTLHDRPPQGVWSAPGRVNLIGEHTDYNDGFVLPFALPHRIVVAAASCTDGMLTVSTVGSEDRVQRADPVEIGSLEPGTLTGWVSYPAGVAWVLRSLGFDGGADLVMISDVPTGAGLSSSAALECAVALALLGLAGIEPTETTGHTGHTDLPEQASQSGATDPRTPSRYTIARWAQRAENEFVGMPSGVLDQTASMCCQDGHVLFLDVRSGRQEQVPFDAAADGLEVLVVDTRANHALVDSGYGDRRKGCERAAELLGIPALRDLGPGDLDAAADRLPDELVPLVRHVVTENQRVLDTVKTLHAGELSAIGTLLTASHESLRTDYEVSCRELDIAVEASLAAGALGARMIGGGFGGSAIALVHGDRRATVESAVTAAFQHAGLRAPRLFTAVPSAGARRDN